MLRYFESREAVLLELLDDFLDAWLDELGKELAAGIEADASPQEQTGRLAEIVSRSLAEWTVLCDLVGAQGGVLEHNVSVELVRHHLPEVGDGAQTFCMMSLISAGALAAYDPPSLSVLAAYADEPDLGVLRLDPAGCVRRGAHGCAAARLSLPTRRQAQRCPVGELPAATGRREAAHSG